MKLQQQFFIIACMLCLHLFLAIPVFLCTALIDQRLYTPCYKGLVTLVTFTTQKLSEPTILLGVNKIMCTFMCPIKLSGQCSFKPCRLCCESTNDAFEVSLLLGGKYNPLANQQKYLSTCLGFNDFFLLLLKGLSQDGQCETSQYPSSRFHYFISIM